MFPEECKSFSGFFVYDSFAPFSFDFKEINIIFYKINVLFQVEKVFIVKRKKQEVIMFIQSNEELNKMYLNLFSKIWELQKEVNQLKEKINDVQKEAEDKWNDN